MKNIMAVIPLLILSVFLLLVGIAGDNELSVIASLILICTSSILFAIGEKK